MTFKRAQWRLPNFLAFALLTTVGWTNALVSAEILTPLEASKQPGMLARKLRISAYSVQPRKKG